MGASGSSLGKWNTTGPSLPMCLSRRSSHYSQARLPSPCVPSQEEAPLSVKVGACLWVNAPWHLWWGVGKPVGGGTGRSLWGITHLPLSFSQARMLEVAPSCPEAIEVAGGGSTDMRAGGTRAHGSRGA